MRCPTCASFNVSRNINGWFDCHYCNHMGSAERFGAKCTCDQPHLTPTWRCEAHGEVAVPADLAIRQGERS